MQCISILSVQCQEGLYTVKFLVTEFSSVESEEIPGDDTELQSAQTTEAVIWRILMCSV